jgi:hypothetical protein
VRLTRLVGIRPLAYTAITILVVMRCVAFAQDVTESALKAAFIYNFVRFTEWPDQFPAADPFVMCVLGDAAVGDALERAVKGREIAGHAIVVSRAATAGSKPACHVLYLSGAMASQRAQLIADLRDAPVLTISDIEGFTDIGGMVQFFFEHGQLRFSIRLESAKRARLQISARLLQLSQRYE